MSREEPVLSQLMVKYPFTPLSRKFFDRLPIEESFSSSEVLRQAESRLLSSIGQGRYAPHVSELIEFSSFFVAVLVASQELYLGQRLARSESDLARRLFIRERPLDKQVILDECFQIKLTRTGPDTAGYGYSMHVEDYLKATAHFELKSQYWRLVNRPLDRGTVYLTENGVNDLFGDLSEKMIYGGVKNLRKVPFPRQLSQVRERLLPLLPPPRVKSTRGYLYVEELLSHPVSDGRHRLTWLVLAPYLINVKNLEEDQAVEKIRSFVAAKGETSSMKRFIEYNVKRAKRNGLMPPTLGKLKAEHPDIYALLPKEITQRYRPAGN
ncbi:MAG: DNA primase noncatalytic subunit PriX [Thaumarchaeota archaeon]|nr:DNA primase noncatalytic subunit PriX [Nitrososphaerota archaeon]